jgi:hypothetical protein
VRVDGTASEIDKIVCESEVRKRVCPKLSFFQAYLPHKTSESVVSRIISSDSKKVKPSSLLSSDIVGAIDCLPIVFALSEIMLARARWL